MNPVALITGGSRGIGRGIAVELAANGFDLVINYASNRAAAEESRKESLAASSRVPGRVEICQADISAGQDRVRLIEFVRQHFGRVDVLVNNAGVAPGQRADVLDTTEESFDRLMGINAKGPYFLTQLAARWMLETPPLADRPRCIVTVSSISAYTASINRGEYCVSKAALSMLTPLFACRLAAHDIRVYEVRPGIIATDMTAPVKQKYDQLIEAGLTPIQRWGTPADVGRVVAALASGVLPFSTGDILNVDGGFHLRRL